MPWGKKHLPTQASRAAQVPNPPGELLSRGGPLPSSGGATQVVCEFPVVHNFSWALLLRFRKCLTSIMARRVSDVRPNPWASPIAGLVEAEVALGPEPFENSPAEPMRLLGGGNDTGYKVE